LKAARPKWKSSHDEYLAFVQGLSFVVLAQPISTRCTITNDVHAKVVGKPGLSGSKSKAKAKSKAKSKAKVGQGDYKSIIFWTKEQTKVMMVAIYIL